MTVKLINNDGELILPIPGDICPKHEAYTVFQTQDGVILYIPLNTI
ncbi:hypothetical protein ABC628_10250 [Lentilactobacillus otakiensis]|jgi:hypothetical protein|uniref:AbrB family transcriptional regulator n=1 Tax=Lentilactobacillus otakiensis DSM 19908 = JCM 15040 TaxID=1423780 RepID=S4PQ95_9LACO|nr:hypothetical protein [Lentilactobacillus otakiensis]MBZ3777477.1 hypothetical protein [Lentilactobacillus otakiensis]MDV3518418.1 hypothetical protein [Lentilactobacillus otakiensis]GAD17020.1 hypothetical protein LOT_1558 [Lentilactobacillus otakiensis DSM 19908 = JCM 15040]